MATSVKNKATSPNNGGAEPRLDSPAARRRVLTPLGITLISLLSALLLAVVVLSVYALSYSRVYPGISAYGVSLGGMTREEATLALSEALGSAYEGRSLDLSLDDNTVTITAQDAAVSLSPEKTVEAVFQAGRTGNIFSRLAFAVSSLTSQRAVEGGSDFYIDSTAVRTIVQTLTQNIPPVEYAWSIGGTSIDVTGGQDGRSSDPDAMTQAVVDRFAALDFSPLRFSSQPVPPQPLPLDDIYEEIAVEPKDAYVVVDDAGQATIMPHTVGVSFDKEKVRQQLEARPETLSIPLLYATPDLTAAVLENNLFRDLLSEYTTSTAGSSQNRITNVDLTARNMNGTILLPGEEFSFNKVVGERTEARGFKMAGAYSNGQLVDAIGGGVCQSSTTLYNAALLANLHIVYRQGHSMTVGYVPLGQDAAVDWGRIDFVFSNDTAYPLRVLAWYQNSRMTVQIWGTKTDDLSVSIENTVLAHTPSQTVTEQNPGLAPGAKTTKTAGHDGWTVQTYRVVKNADGSIAYRNPEAKTSYRKVDTVIEVGPGVPTGGELPDDPVTPVSPSPPPVTPPPSPPPVTPSPPPVTPTPEPSPIPEPTDPAPVTPDPTPTQPEETPGETEEDTDDL